MRSAVAAALVVAVASVLAGAVLLVTAREILLDNVTTAAQDRATQVVAAVAAGEPDSLAAALRPSPGERAVVQVLDAAGRVIAGSDAVADAPPMSALRPGPGRRATEQREVRQVDVGDERERRYGLPLRLAAGHHSPHCTVCGVFTQAKLGGPCQCGLNKGGALLKGGAEAPRG